MCLKSKSGQLPAMPENAAAKAKEAGRLSLLSWLGFVAGALILYLCYSNICIDGFLYLLRTIALPSIVSAFTIALTTELFAFRKICDFGLRYKWTVFFIGLITPAVTIAGNYFEGTGIIGNLWIAVWAAFITSAVILVAQFLWIKAVDFIQLNLF